MEVKQKTIKLISLFFFLFSLFTIHYSLFTREVLAICPVCTIAVGAGLGISRALGIDDAVTSVWIGGLILSMSFWFIDWLGKKNLKFLTTHYLLLTIFLMYLLTLLPLWYGKFIGRFNNQIFGVDKILFGTAIGSAAFLLGKWLDQKIRERKGKQLFVYQKVVFPLTSLFITSIILHFIIKSL